MKSIKASVVLTSKDLFPEPINLITRTPMIVSQSRSTSQRHEIEPAASELLFDSKERIGNNGILYFYAEADSANSAGIDISIITKSGGRSTFMKLLPGEAGYLPVYSNDQAGVSIEAKNLDMILPGIIKYVYWSRDIIDQIAERGPYVKPATTTTTTTEAPLDFDITANCFSLGLGGIYASNFTGGTPPYYAGNAYFTTESAALSCSSWSGVTIAQGYGTLTSNDTFWIVAKDSIGTLKAKSITTTCPQPFISRWREPGGEVKGGPIRLPIYDGGNYNFTVDWGDGTVETITSYLNNSHNYSIPGDYTVTITGTIEGWNFSNVPASRNNILEILQWGCLKLKNTGEYFFNCSNLTLTSVSDTPNLTGITSVSRMFQGCTSLTTVNNMNSWDMSGILTLDAMFSFCASFNQDISGWDVSNVNLMIDLFYQCSLFNQDLSSWCVSNFTVEPGNFSNGASSWILPKPVWGTCP